MTNSHITISPINDGDWWVSGSDMGNFSTLNAAIANVRKQHSAKGQCVIRLWVMSDRHQALTLEPQATRLQSDDVWTHTFDTPQEAIAAFETYVGMLT